MQHGSIQSEDAALSASLARSLGPLVSDSHLPHPASYDDAVCTDRGAIQILEEEVIKSRLNEWRHQQKHVVMASAYLYVRNAANVPPVAATDPSSGRLSGGCAAANAATMATAKRAWDAKMVAPPDTSSLDQYFAEAARHVAPHLADLPDMTMDTGTWPNALRVQNVTFISKISSQSAVAARIADNLPTVARTRGLANCYKHFDPSLAERPAVLHGMPDTYAHFLFSANVDKPTILRGGEYAMRVPPPDNDIAQGDPSSPLRAAVVAATHKAILRSTVDVLIYFDTYVDDRTALTNSLEADRLYTQGVARLDHLTGQHEDP
ncbi:unnamed protein product [Prorocentrum cordatum]|uniref:Uncharacterized protein n=1 Tax=Prorocentrum cordatum TaxID=2364126 RepID=A0ABN9VDK7_9DINO|nr:unnamed protein product [Polarella glacialis]